MKMPKIMRPQLELEFVGIKGFFAALFAICKIGIRKCSVNLLINLYTENAGTVKRVTFYVIPKYRLKRVTEIAEESEGEKE